MGREDALEFYKYQINFNFILQYLSCSGEIFNLM